MLGLVFGTIRKHGDAVSLFVHFYAELLVS